MEYTNSNVGNRTFVREAQTKKKIPTIAVVAVISNFDT